MSNLWSNQRVPILEKPEDVQNPSPAPTHIEPPSPFEQPISPPFKVPSVELISSTLPQISDPTPEDLPEYRTTIEEDPFSILDILLSKDVTPSSHSSKPLVTSTEEANKLIQQFRSFFYSSPLEVLVESLEKKQLFQEILTAIEAFPDDTLPKSFDAEVAAATDLFNKAYSARKKKQSIATELTTISTFQTEKSNLLKNQKLDLEEASKEQSLVRGEIEKLEKRLQQLKAQDDLLTTKMNSIKSSAKEVTLSLGQSMERKRKVVVEENSNLSSWIQLLIDFDQLKSQYQIL
ncbi:unnamed protein product [Sphenostylis stenocarpa]|uniref:Uncharacterized protein n=1 Tax=Sphenostylis stenocarpa TaxID=92480 RepID=A0AA86VHX7_9FABA|nr:unnamed protein product [Sphenostylis stenocarpa]